MLDKCNLVTSSFPCDQLSHADPPANLTEGEGGGGGLRTRTFNRQLLQQRRTSHKYFRTSTTPPPFFFPDAIAPTIYLVVFEGFVFGHFLSDFKNKYTVAKVL